ncbi:MAG: hypothetical protein IPM63_14295 [Acidobacteriota bacterium]|nr:MAG: hypothetical protein IPM63_14295 [Acidobacteriota bacterium]
MSTDQQTNIDFYLFGELAGEELEAFEESYFLDDDLFEQVETAEMRLIDRYVRSEMDSDETARFEQGYLVSPERHAKVTAARVFHRELARLKPESKGFLAGLFEGFSFRIPVLQFASIATILLIAIGILWSLWILQTQPQPVAEANLDTPTVPVSPDANGSPLPGNRNDREVNDSSGPGQAPTSTAPPVRQNQSNQVFATLAFVPGMRTTNVFRAVRIGDDTTQLNLSIQLPESAAAGNYSVWIRDLEEQEIWSRTLISSKSGEKGPVLEVIVGRDDLKFGRFRVTAERVGTESRYRYGLEILREDPKTN